MSPLFPSGPRDRCHIPKQTWVPRLNCHGAEGAGEDVAAISPLALECLVTPRWDHNL